MSASSPRITVITPSFNHAAFLRQCINSVLNQHYPNLQYMVLDGGSTDGTLDILRSYGERIVWKSERDRGQADAVNRGLRAADGEIIGWLNSDDFYLPNCLTRVVACFGQHPSAVMIYGRALIVDRNGDSLREYPTFDLTRRDLSRKCYICQPAVFLRRSARDEVGLLNEHLDICLDYEWWLRIGRMHEPVFCDHVLVASRHHSMTKTSARRLRALVEAGYLMREHFGAGIVALVGEMGGASLDAQSPAICAANWGMGVGAAKCDTIPASVRRKENAIALRIKDDRTSEDAATLAEGERIALSSAALVVCAGIPRSGSTWLYNAARLILAHASGQTVYGAWIEQYDAGNTAAWHVVKVHEPDEALAWRARITLTSRRDLRDIAASAWKRGWVSDVQATVAFLDTVIAQHAFWRRRAAYEMVYEQMRGDQPAELRRIAGVLNATVGDVALQQIAQEIEALQFAESSDGEFDSTTLLHKQHIMDGRTGYYIDSLPPELIAQVQQRYGEWLRPHGYATT